MLIDRFTETSAERFRTAQPTDIGNRAMFFPYIIYGENLPPIAVGLWLSRQLVKTQIEGAHYMPDSDCQRALRQSDAHVNTGVVWLGLPVEVHEEEGERPARIFLPKFLIKDYERLAIGQVSLHEELEERFSVVIEQV